MLKINLFASLMNITLHLTKPIDSSIFNWGQMCRHNRLDYQERELIAILGKLRETAEDGPHLPTIYCGAQFVN